MKRFEWNEEKNEWLKEKRGISFDEVVDAVENNYVLDVFQHENQKRHPGQYVLLITIKDYVYEVPFVIQKDESWFLKTMYPSRKYTKRYIKKEKYENFF